MPLLTPFPSVKRVKIHARQCFYVAQCMEKKTLRKPVLGSAVFIMFSKFLQINCKIVVWLIFYVLCCCILYHRERMYRYRTYPVCFVEKNSGSSVPLPPPHIFPNDFERVVDSHWFQCGSGSSISGQCLSGFGSRVLMSKNCKMLLLEKNNIFYQKFQYTYFSLCLHEGRPSYRESLQFSKENTQHLKKLHFFSYFFLKKSFSATWIRIWIRIVNANPDPANQNQWDPCGSWSTTLLVYHVQTRSL
jgi:hypothetical protein